MWRKDDKICNSFSFLTIYNIIKPVKLEWGNTEDVFLVISYSILHLLKVSKATTTIPSGVAEQVWLWSNCGPCPG